MSEQDTRPTPPSGMPAAVAATSVAKPSIKRDEIQAPKSAEASAILEALDAMRAEIQETRKESRERGEETAAQFDKLYSKVDKLTSDDEEHRLNFRRLEQRQAGTDEEVRILREELRKDREQRSEERAKMGESFEGMKRFVEQATKANTESIAQVMKANEETLARFDTATMATEQAMMRLDMASAKFDSGASDMAAVKAQNARQDERLEAIEGTQNLMADELGLEPKKPGATSALVPVGHAGSPEIKKPTGRIQTLTRQQKASAVLIVVMNLSSALLYWLTTHH